MGVLVIRPWSPEDGNEMSELDELESEAGVAEKVVSLLLLLSFLNSQHREVEDDTEKR